MGGRVHHLGRGLQTARRVGCSGSLGFLSRLCFSHFKIKARIKDTTWIAASGSALLAMTHTAEDLSLRRGRSPTWQSKQKLITKSPCWITSMHARGHARLRWHDVSIIHSDIPYPAASWAANAANVTMSDTVASMGTICTGFSMPTSSGPMTVPPPMVCNSLLEM